MRLGKSTFLPWVLGLMGMVGFPGTPAGGAPHGEDDLQELLVTGVRPGPGMWRVSRDGHELWILATLEPLPRELVWHSQAVESRIGVSSVVLAPPRVSADVGFFRGLTLLPSLLRARHLGDGESLGRILPHDLYMRWLALRVKYLGRSDDETLRPMLAALDLYTHALAASGLRLDDAVWPAVERSARRQHVPVQSVTAQVAIGDPKAAIRELGLISRQAEISCLETTIARLETDIPGMRQRANMWSLGDIAGLRETRHPDEQIACLNAFESAPGLREKFLEVRQRLANTWLQAAQDALGAHGTSFAVVPIGEWLRPGGWLEDLRLRGCTVDDPR